jgi:hypothetical protein
MSQRMKTLNDPATPSGSVSQFTVGCALTAGDSDERPCMLGMLLITASISPKSTSPPANGAAARYIEWTDARSVRFARCAIEQLPSRTDQACHPEQAPFGRQHVPRLVLSINSFLALCEETRMQVIGRHGNSWAEFPVFVRRSPSSITLFLKAFMLSLSPGLSERSTRCSVESAIAKVAAGDADLILLGFVDSSGRTRWC